jgi:hypothetical protein
MLFGAIEHLSWRHVKGGQTLDVPGTARAMASILLNGLKAPKRRSRR